MSALNSEEYAQCKAPEDQGSDAVNQLSVGFEDIKTRCSCEHECDNNVPERIDGHAE